ncbi:hypothetical protein ACO0K0_01230 [Undibacterium sp. SXout11W]|uniref:hypothetical protein n=1 Tax=Undibacterium sp. SXout11W TaxID=3413050 RepID=UPI003BF1035D
MRFQHAYSILVLKATVFRTPGFSILVFYTLQTTCIPWRISVICMATPAMFNMDIQTHKLPQRIVLAKK